MAAKFSLPNFIESEAIIMTFLNIVSLVSGIITIAQFILNVVRYFKSHKN